MVYIAVLLALIVGVLVGYLIGHRHRRDDAGLVSECSDILPALTDGAS